MSIAKSSFATRPRCAHTCSGRIDMPRLLELWRQGRLKLDHLTSGHIKLHEINEGFAMLKSGAPVNMSRRSVAPASY